MCCGRSPWGSPSGQSDGPWAAALGLPDSACDPPPPQEQRTGSANSGRTRKKELGPSSQHNTDRFVLRTLPAQTLCLAAQRVCVVLLLPALAAADGGRAGPGERQQQQLTGCSMAFAARCQCCPRCCCRLDGGLAFGRCPGSQLTAEPQPAGHRFVHNAGLCCPPENKPRSHPRHSSPCLDDFRDGTLTGRPARPKFLSSHRKIPGWRYQSSCMDMAKRGSDKIIKVSSVTDD